jgi:plasmid maintenance system antidote protein VapI
MSNTLTPARAISPGRILQRELNARSWTPNDLAETTGLSIQAIDEIIISQPSPSVA